MTKLLGGALLVGMGLMWARGLEPFAAEERTRVEGGVRRGPGGVLLWTGGLHGGK